MIAGISLPAMSAFDPEVEGEGSIDPMGLATISERLADLLVPGVRARMQRIRFVTATAVGASAWETLADEPSVDEISTPSICFEWLVLEAFVRHGGANFPAGVPGVSKTRTVVARSERLSAHTYLKGPSVFGFNGVYKPFAVSGHITDSGLEPGARCAELTRRWERDQGLDGFTDGVPGSHGARFRANIRDEVRKALKAGQCTAPQTGVLLKRLSLSLRPDKPGPAERRFLRTLIFDPQYETRAELARHLSMVPGQPTEAELLQTVLPKCSAPLAKLVDAVMAYERFAALVDAAFRTLCCISHSQGTQPLTAKLAKDNEMVVHCAKELPDHYREAATRMSEVGVDRNLEERLGEFAIRRTPEELVDLTLEHHERVQASKLPNGKRPWFDPLRDGVVVRRAFGSPTQPELGDWFVHPIRVAPLRRFLEDTKT